VGYEPLDEVPADHDGPGEPRLDGSAGFAPGAGQQANDEDAFADLLQRLDLDMQGLPALPVRPPELIESVRPAEPGPLQHRPQWDDHRVVGEDPVRRVLLAVQIGAVAVELVDGAANHRERVALHRPQYPSGAEPGEGYHGGGTGAHMG
jgi:hypothetical protein